MKSISCSVLQMFAMEYLRDGSMIISAIQAAISRFTNNNECTIFLMSLKAVGNGLGDDGLEMYEQMRNNGLFLNEETFLAVLDCAGLIGCYGKPGHLAEALESEEILINLDPSKVDPKKIPTPLPNTAISMLEGKNMVGEFMNLTLYKDEEKLKATNKEQSYVPDTRYVLHDMEEFCLVTRLKFRVKNWTDIMTRKSQFPLGVGCIFSSLHGRPIRGNNVETLIKSEAFKKLDDNDAVSLHCVGILHLVLLGLEDRRPISNWILWLANDRDGWDKRWPALYATQPIDEVDKKSYLITGFAWAFKGQLPVQRLVTDEIEAQSRWSDRRSWPEGWLSGDHANSWIQILIRERAENDNWTLSKSGIVPERSFRVMFRWEGETVILGDFNKVQIEQERFGFVFNAQGANVFNNSYSMTNLIDLPLGGYSFTWAHKTATNMSKLDRFLISEGLLVLFPYLTGLCLDRHLSNHRPIVMYESFLDCGPTPFRMFHSWFKMEGFDKLLEDSWKSMNLIESNAMICLKKNFQLLKYTIKNWSKENKAKLNATKVDVQKSYRRWIKFLIKTKVMLIFLIIVPHY
nr:RNA-directed DNA polymerase, eukaryota [Tanacetum cinerariifolium]